jgi:sugar lactone lactonase YvrE
MTKENPTASVFSDTVCHLGEGPVAHPALGRVFWFDIMEKRLLEQAFEGPATTTIHDLPFMASALAVIDDDRQLLVTDQGLYVREVATNTLTLHTPLEADNPVTRSNDARAHPSGALWIGTMGRRFEKGAGSIYWFFKGEVRTLFPDITIPNSIAFAPDGSLAYFADTPRGTIWRVETNPATGLPSSDPQIFRTFENDNGFPDGSVVDQDGILWNARWGAASVDAYSPDGTRIRSIAMPARQVSCPAFIGPNADRLAVTSAYEGMDEAARAADPLAGQTFLIDLPVRGRFDPPVKIA